jgi:hypothetical protein
MALLAGGCELIPRALDMEHGSLLQAADVLTTPQTQCSLRVRLERGWLLVDQSNREVHFMHEGKLVASARTDDDGWASASYTPSARGDYLFEVQVPPATRVGVTLKASLLVACRLPEDRMLVTDIDDTLLPQEYRLIAFGQPEPFAMAPDVLRRLATDFTIVYLTRRPERLGPKTKYWLERNSFPRGPVLMPDLGQAYRGGGPYKRRTLATLKEQFPRIEVGVGNALGDVQVYLESGMSTYWMLKTPRRASDRRELASQLSALRGDVQVVENWLQVQAGVLEGRRFPPSQALWRLKEPAN